MEKKKKALLKPTLQNYENFNKINQRIMNCKSFYIFCLLIATLILIKGKLVYYYYIPRTVQFTPNNKLLKSLKFNFNELLNHLVIHTDL